MMMVFLVDQLQKLGCKLFGKALKKAKRISYLWSSMRGYIDVIVFSNWGELLSAVAFGVKLGLAKDILLNTS